MGPTTAQAPDAHAGAETLDAHPAPEALDAYAWQESWDRQQTAYMPDREERLGVLCDLAEAVGVGTPGEPLRVLDLACGTGSITRRLLARVPAARVTAVDVDPALLRLASGTFAADGRVRVVTADLADPAWRDALDGAYDAVLTATALHWVPEARLRDLYAELAGVVRPGGVVANADHMPDEETATPRLAEAVETLREARRQASLALPGSADWGTWWDRAADEPALADAVAARRERFGPGDHPAEFTPPAAWHVDALRAGGFAEAGVVWRSHRDAVVAAVR